MRRFLLGGIVAIPLMTGSALAANFVASVTSHVPGSVFVASGDTYNNTSAVVGKPGGIVDPTSAWASALTPFSPHYTTDELLAVGLGGSVTLQFQTPVPVNGQTKVAVYTNAGMFDSPFGAGKSLNNHTATHYEYGAERTALVEVGDANGNFVSLGRVIFDDPSNYYANATDPYQFPAPTNPQVADYEKPYDGTTSLAGLSLSQILSAFNGSAGGTWITVPADIGLASITQMRLSGTQWRLDDGTLVDERTSIYDDEYTKPADLFIDAAVAVPEPATLALMGSAGLMVLRRRRA